jgi:hypothetical protein
VLDAPPALAIVPAGPLLGAGIGVGAATLATPVSVVKGTTRPVYVVLEYRVREALRRPLTSR